MVFSEKIKELRKSKNLTQSQLAERLGITRAAVSAYENGIRMPAYNLLAKIAGTFNVTIDSLIGDVKSDMIDISGIDKDQRAIVEELIKYFKAFNEITQTALDKSNDSLYSKILTKHNLYGNFKNQDTD